MSRVERMLELNKDLLKAKTAPDKTAIERQIAATDREDETLRRTQGNPRGRIDHLVHELHGLTDEEIRIVEGGMRP